MLFNFEQHSYIERHVYVKKNLVYLVYLVYLVRRYFIRPEMILAVLFACS